MTKTWFIGCTHFGHNNILRLADRPFKTIEEHDEVLLERWNSKVGKNDVVYHLGDVTWKNPAKLLQQLKGRIVLIVGNHDDQDGGLHYALNALPHVHYLEDMMLGPTGMVLCHYPMEDWNWRFRGSIHLHAHTHQKQFKRPLLPHIAFTPETERGERGLAWESVPADAVPCEKWIADNYGIVCNRFNVGADATNFAPVELDELLAHARA